MATKTATITGKNQKISRKVREDSVEALKTIRVSLNFIYDLLKIFSIPMETGNHRIKY